MFAIPRIKDIGVLSFIGLIAAADIAPRLCSRRKPSLRDR
jgi:hypothetical protein